MTQPSAQGVPCSPAATAEGVGGNVCQPSRSEAHEASQGTVGTASQGGRVCKAFANMDSSSQEAPLPGQHRQATNLQVLNPGSESLGLLCHYQGTGNGTVFLQESASGKEPGVPLPCWPQGEGTCGNCSSVASRGPTSQRRRSE